VVDGRSRRIRSMRKKRKKWKKYEKEINRNDKLTGCKKRLRKRAHVREKYELCVVNMWLEGFTE
jgi:hypothetical protein